MSGQNEHFHWRLLAAFLVGACAYLFFLDPWGHDTWFHLQRLQDIDRQFGWGHMRAYFAENAAQNKGLPVWIYYSQWIYWPAMLLASGGLSPLVALKLVYCVLLIVCCVGCYQLLRLHAGESDAAFGTLLFMTSNYVVGEVFQRSAYSEFMSVALLPLLLLDLHRVVLHGDGRAGTRLVVLCALMVLAHPLSFMNSGLAIAAYATFVLARERVPPSRFVPLVPLFALGFAMTAFYWLPAVIETKYVLGAEGVPTPLRETFLSVWRYLKFSGITSLGFVLTLLTPVVTTWVLLQGPGRHAYSNRSLWPLIAAGVAYVLLTFRVSEPLYDLLPLLASNLWVWRVVFHITLLAVLIVTIGLPVLPPRLRSKSVLRGLGVLAVLQAVALVAWNTKDEVSIRPVPIAAIEERIAVESQIKDGFGIDEYLPQPRLLPRLKRACADIRTIQPGDRNEMGYAIGLDDRDACIHVPRYWNTRYVASIDGVATRVYADQNGEVLIGPGGKPGLLSLRVRDPGYVTFANLLSVAATLLFLARFVRKRR